MPKAKAPPAPARIVPDFGLDWKTMGNGAFAGTNELQRRLYCARFNKGNTPVFEHRKLIARMLWPEQVFSWHAWTDKRMMSVCQHNFVTWMAGGGTGKTTDAAIIALQYWLEAPHRTAVICCSTSKDMLRTRIWGQIVHFHAMLPPEDVMIRSGFVGRGELLDASTFIRYKDGDWKNGIKGVAVQEGPVQEAVNNIIGMHTDRVFWILDEMQGVREAIMSAIPNLLKNPESKMLGMGNPDSFTSMLCRYSEPKHGGWPAIRKFQSHWEIDSQGYKGTGIAIFFDGRKSPAVLDPAWGRRNPWMLNQEQLDAHRNSKAVGGNENHPDYMCQSIGWPPSQGIEATVLDGAILSTFNCTGKVVWTQGVVACAALDPAFNGGDRAILRFGQRGYVSDKDGARWVIQGTDWIDVPIDGESNRPIHYQIMDFCKAECMRRGIGPREFAVAAAGEGGGLVSIFETEWGPINGIEEGGKASERIVNERGTKAKDEYDTRASELCFGVRDFALGNGIRGLSDKEAEQFCARQTFYKNGKWCAEPKTGSKGRKDVGGNAVKGFKERMGYSPDHADSFQILVEHCRMRGAEPAFATGSPQRAEEWDHRRQTQQTDHFNENNYATETDWREEAVGFF